MSFAKNQMVTSGKRVTPSSKKTRIPSKGTKGYHPAKAKAKASKM